VSIREDRPTGTAFGPFLKRLFLIAAILAAGIGGVYASVKNMSSGPSYVVPVVIEGEESTNTVFSDSTTVKYGNAVSTEVSSTTTSRKRTTSPKE